MLKPFAYKLNEVEETRASGLLLHPYPIDIFDPAPAKDTPNGDVTIDDAIRRKTVGVLLQTRDERRILEARKPQENNHLSPPPSSPTQDEKTEYVSSNTTLLYTGSCKRPL